MKIYRTFIALAILLMLGGVLYYLEQNPMENPTDEIPKEKLFSFDAEQVEEFTIEVPNDPTVTIRRLADSKPPEAASGQESEPETASAPQWEIVSPAGVAADSMLIQSFVDALPDLEYTPVSEETPASLEEFGLDQPKKVFKFRLRQGEPVTLLLGAENPSGYAKYGMLKSSPGLFLLDSALSSALDKTLFDLRDKRVLPIDMNQAQRLELQNPRKIVMTKLSNGNWELTQPAVRADYGSTGYFVTRLTGARIDSVEEESPRSLGRYGLDRPQIRLQITTPDGTHSLLVGKSKTEGTGYYAKNSVWPQVFTVNQSFYDQLNDAVEEYRNRYLFDFETSDTRRVEIETSEQELRFDKQEDNWFKAADPPVNVETKVDVFLNNIHALRIQQYTTDRPGRLAQYGLDKPWMKVKVTFGEDNREETVLFGPHGDKFYAARQGEPSVYEMRSEERENIQKWLEELSS